MATDVAYLRILFCLDCGTLDEVPNFDGPPEYDDLLEYAASKHETPSGLRHRGQLFTVEENVWRNDEARRGIVNQLREGSKGVAEIEPSFYNVRDTFKEDAMACYKAHRRPKEDCADWRSERKRLLPDTKAERKDAGLSLRPVGPARYLCDFCPVRAHYEKKANEMKGIK